MNNFQLYPWFAFSLISAFGIGIGMYWSISAVSDSERSFVHQLLDTAIVGLCGALMVGRTAYVLVNGSYFQENVSEIPAFWRGGISWIGAQAGAFVAILVTASYKKIHFPTLLDALMPSRGKGEERGLGHALNQSGLQGRQNLRDTHLHGRGSEVPPGIQVHLGLL